MTLSPFARFKKLLRGNYGVPFAFFAHKIIEGGEESARLFLF